VGSCRRLQDWLNDALYTASVNVVSFPVFFNPPDGLQGFLHPGRIVLGYEKDQPRRVMDELFADLLLHDASIFHVSWESAEMMRAVDSPVSTGIPEVHTGVEPVRPVERVYS
jgi:UDP-glucose 6-dehydrogenase